MHSCSIWQLVPQFPTESHVLSNGYQERDFYAVRVPSLENEKGKRKCLTNGKKQPFSRNFNNTQTCRNELLDAEKRHCFRDVHRDRCEKNNSLKQIYANLKKIDVTALVLFYFMFGCLFMGRAACYTITCPVGCSCIYGDDNQKLMDKFLGSERQIDTWVSLKNHYETITTYICSNVHNIPKGTTANARALFLDDNSIAIVKSTDLVPDSLDYNVMSPTALLSMSNSEISSIEENAFLPLLNLKYLILQNNLISDLSWLSSDLPNFKRLTELDLSTNKISKFQFGNTGNFESLTRLDLSGNRIDSVDGNLLSKFPQLKHLDISSNLIKTQGLVPSSSVIFSIESLLVSNNKLDRVSYKLMKFLKPFSNLEALDLSKNRIYSGEISSKAFSELSTLKSLNLSGCSIKKLRQGWLNGGPDKSLEVLDLSHNLLPSLSAYSLSSVFTIDLNSSLSRDMYDTTVYHETLVSDFTKIPTENVERHWLRPLERLAVLFLNGNRGLTRIEDDTFDFVPNLRHLFLQNCAIRRLNIASIRYRYGAHPVARTLPQLKYIWIFGNPIVCDCYVRFIKDWTVEVSYKNNTGRIDDSSYTMNNYTKSIDVEIAACVSPASLAGQAIVTTSGREMACQDEPYSILIAMLIGPLAFAGSVLLTIICGSIHACFVRMKKGAVLSYRAREEMMKKPSNGVRRRAAPPHIFNGFGWNRPVPQEENTGHSAGRTGLYTNIVLGQLGPRTEEHPTRTTSQFPPMSAHSTTSLIPEEHRSYRNETKNDSAFAVPLLVKEAGASKMSQEKPNSNIGWGTESIRTRRLHASDVPFIDEKYQQQTRTYSSKLRPSSSIAMEENPLLSYKHRKSSFTTLSGSRDDSNVMTSSGSEKSHSSQFAIPNPSTDSHESTEEVCL